MPLTAYEAKLQTDKVIERIQKQEQEAVDYFIVKVDECIESAIERGTFYAQVSIPMDLNSTQLKLVQFIFGGRGFEAKLVSTQSGKDLLVEWKNATSEIPSIQLNHDPNAKYGKM